MAILFFDKRIGAERLRIEFQQRNNLVVEGHVFLPVRRIHVEFHRHVVAVIIEMLSLKVVVGAGETYQVGHNRI